MRPSGGTRQELPVPRFHSVPMPTRRKIVCARRHVPEARSVPMLGGRSRRAKGGTGRSSAGYSPPPPPGPLVDGIRRAEAWPSPRKSCVRPRPDAARSGFRERLGERFGCTRQSPPDGPNVTGFRTAAGFPRSRKSVAASGSPARDWNLSSISSAKGLPVCAWPVTNDLAGERRGLHRRNRGNRSWPANINDSPTSGEDSGKTPAAADKRRRSRGGDERSTILDPPAIAAPRASAGSSKPLARRMDAA